MGKRPSKTERRRGILEAARKVFARKGFAATRMVDIADEAKVGKGTLYEHFRGKEDLFTTLVVSAARESLETLSYAGLSADPEHALREAIGYIVQVALVENLDLYSLFFDFWGSAALHRRDAQERLREVDATFKGFVTNLVRAGQATGVFRAEADPEQFCYVLSAAVDGLSLRLVIQGEEVDLKAYTTCLQELLVGGLVTGGSLKGASVLREEQK